MTKTIKKNKLERFDWRDYELQILKFYSDKYPKRIVLDNQKVKGKFSKQLRQIDVAIFSKTNPERIEYVVECKYLSRKVNISALDGLFGKLHDIGSKKGIIVTTLGFSVSTENYARTKNIELQKIDFEFLKDYYYIPPSEIPDIYDREIRYATPYCKICDITILYEIGIVYGMAEHEPIYCPKCKIQLYETRSDANHRVIKLFKGKEIIKTDLNSVIAKHIFTTRNEWTSIPWQFGIKTKKKNCFICKNEYNDDSPLRTIELYKNKEICSECYASKRTLLIDFDYI